MDYKGDIKRTLPESFDKMKKKKKKHLIITQYAWKEKVMHKTNWN